MLKFALQRPLEFWLGLPLAAGMLMATLSMPHQHPALAPIASRAPIFEASGILDYAGRRRNSLVLRNGPASLHLFCDAAAFSAGCAGKFWRIQGPVHIHYFKYRSRNVVRDIAYENGLPYVTWEQRLVQLRDADNVGKKFTFFPAFIFGAASTLILLGLGVGPILLALRLRDHRRPKSG
jgi:hypothetical protein